MIAITKDEAMALRARYGDDIGITITNRHKKGGRKHYYTEETNRVFYFLERYRSKQLRKVQQKREARAYDRVTQTPRRKRGAIYLATR